jgi:FAD/FMN-containing dehydrogenase
MNKDIIKKIKAIIGNKNILLDEVEKNKYLSEWRGRYKGKALAVIKPNSTSEISRIMRLFHKENIKVIPQGGNTGLVGGQISFDENHIVLSMERLNNIREINILNNSITVESGVLLSVVQNICDEYNILFPLSLASEGSCTIGGNIATNAGGVAVLYYGNMRDLTLGLEVVLSDGTILDGLKSLKKDNTGYSLKDLFVGSEGTLGIVTAATLKTFPKPDDKFTLLCNTENPLSAVKLMRFIQSKIITPLTAFELMNKNSVELVIRHIKGAKLPIKTKANWYVLLEFSKIGGSVDPVNEIQDNLNIARNIGLLSDVVFSNSLKQSEELWSLRDNISESQKKEGASIKNDISVPVSSIQKFINSANKIVEECIPNSKCITFGHIGDGNIHYNISQPQDMNIEDFYALEKKLRDRILNLVSEHKGSFSAEHGIGIARKSDALKYKEKEIKVMQSIKRSLDPKNILNPNKIFD